jgi:pheromone a factor receptor
MAQPVGLSDLWPAQPILYSLSLAAILIPAPAHFKTGNAGVILLACWILVSQSILLVNSIIWRGNTNNNIPYYCDLTTAIFAAAPTGYSASLLCITRQLYNLSRAQAVIISKSQKRKDLLIDLSIGLGIPILVAGGRKCSFYPPLLLARLIIDRRHRSGTSL